jgi:hypothetical protein
MGLSAATEVAPEPLSQDLRDLAGEARSTVRSLRSLLNNIYPVDVPADGWVHGLDPMVDALRERGVVVDLDARNPARADHRAVDAARRTRPCATFPRTDASHVSIKLEHVGSAVTLDIVDDGVGFDDEVAKPNATPVTSDYSCSTTSPRTQVQHW